MKKRKLNGTDISISEIGFGCASYFATKSFSDKSASKIIHTALEKDINYFDTGASYGNGLAEQRLGKTIKNNRKDLIISTKIGSFKNGLRVFQNYNVDFLEQQVIQSLKNLETDYIDILYLHGPSIPALNEDTIKLLEKLKSQGTARFIGINCFHNEVINYSLNISSLDVYMIDYNIIRIDREPIIDEIYSKGKTIIAATPLANNYYSNDLFKITSIKKLWYLARALIRRRKDLKLARNFTFLNDYHNIPAHQIALNFTLKNAKIASAVIGTVSEKHLIENTGYLNYNIDNEIYSKIIETYNTIAKAIG